ncbi:Polysialic acid transport protein KpsD [Andreprevotia sp. IGB-42]|uniref:SLBB domain-containing protein n=1 Tax=Andreprevotia sp. IGB-42 TaxID=2497473 RepID=UPI00135A5342|nr:SLBB domain-containing protein [Andreprevotia sp. IGB-42]KAF0815385.1 Polysialic acid transport protein KpsD [Andreprevotia sp. IGB-42]
MMRRLLIAFCVLLCALPAFAAAEYRLGAGDVVKITVYDHDDLNTELQLTQSGELAFPLIGRIKLAGLTFSETERLIATKLDEGGFVKKAFVNVLITQYRSQRVTVIGEVNKPGRYDLDGVANIVDAVALAGGVAPTGGDRVVLTRGETRNEILLSQFLSQSKEGDPATQIRNGDVIFVPRMQQIYVYGEVNRPGAFRLEPGMTVVQAIAAAGGFNQRATKRGLEIERRKPEGGTAVIAPRLSDPVQDNDVINVQESLF